MIKESKTPIHGYLPVKKICKYILGSAQCFKDIFRMAPYCLVGMAHVILHQILGNFCLPGFERISLFLPCFVYNT